MSFSRTATVVVDRERCTGCGACVPVCPARTFQVIDGVATVVGTHSIHCGHCEAVCPVGAISQSGVQQEAQAFETFAFDDQWLPGTEVDLAELVRLMASRRSCRDYTDEPVSKTMLEDLVRVGITAPSGTNSQRWTFTLVPQRKQMLDVASHILRFFKRLNGYARNGLLRNGLRLIGRAELHEYYQRYYATIAHGIEEYERDGTDRLWNGATAAIFIGTQPGASTAVEDGLLAAQNIMLAAHAMGLGSCLIGFAVAAMAKDRTIQTKLGIPREEKIHAVVALGHTNERYQRCAGRKLPIIRHYEG